MSAAAAGGSRAGLYIPGTINRFGGSAHAEYGSLRAISYPTALFGTVTTRYNDFRSAYMQNPLPGGLVGAALGGGGGLNGHHAVPTTRELATPGRARSRGAC